MIIASIVLHGISATLAMLLLERRRVLAARNRHGDPAEAARIPV